MSVSRREFLAASAAALAASGKLPAQGPAANARRFDLHHHFGTPDWIRMTAMRQSQGYQTWQPYTPAKALEDMDRGGV